MKIIFGAKADPAAHPQIAEERHPDLPGDVTAAQDFAEIMNAAKRRMERMAQYQAWVSPEAIKARQEAWEKAAAEALERGKRASRNLEYIEPPDPLPKHMQGQSPSTVQAMLRQERDEKLWKT